jgi:hypothetical protein
MVKLKGNRYGVTGIFWRALIRDAAGDLLVLKIDDYNFYFITSAVMAL